MTRNFPSSLALIVILALSASANFALAASVSVPPAIGTPTTKATFSGSGFTAGEPVNLLFDASTAGSSTVDAGGNFTQTVLIPKSAQPGAHTIQAVGQS